MQISIDRFVDEVQKLRDLKRPFAIATVIAVRGSASAKPGSKALIDESGKNVWGWVGGGCAETFVAKNAVESMADGLTRIVQADLDDEIFGLGMPCGGIMDVYIEPQRPVEKILIEEAADLGDVPVHFARSMGFEPSFEIASAGPGSPLERSVYAIARAMARARNQSFESLKTTRGIFSDVTPWSQDGLSELLVVGSSRITEELAKLGTMLRWPVRVYGWNLDKSNYPASVQMEESQAGFTNFSVKPGSAVMVASHHKGDHDFIRQSLESRANYVGLVASPKRAGLIFEHLKELGVAEELLPKIFAPAGLEMKCNGPQEIALSAVAEIIQLKNTTMAAPRKVH